MKDPKYLTNKELLAKLARIEEVNDKLDKYIQENDRVHKEFCDEFKKLLEKEEIEIGKLRMELDKMYNKYFAAKRRFYSE